VYLRHKKKKVCPFTKKEKGLWTVAVEFDQQPVMNENNCDEKQQTFDDLLFRSNFITIALTHSLTHQQQWLSTLMW
jgi:hypothetical protein